MIDITKFVRKANGRFFTITFTKRDGSVRVLNGRTGVNDSVVETPKLFIVYDVKLQAFRSVRKESILSITTDGFTLTANRAQ